MRYIKTALKKEPQQMIDLLIKRITLYDDKIEIVYKLQTAKIPTIIVGILLFTGV